MRVPKGLVPVLAKRIITALTEKRLVDLKAPADEITDETERLLLDELSIEDRLNEEIRTILKQYETEIERGRLDYRKLFDMTKLKIIRERNLIL